MYGGESIELIMIDANTNIAAIDSFIEVHEAIQALPENATRIIRITSDPDCNKAQLLKLISADAALAARIMRAVNSAYYGLANKITRLDFAISFMGNRAVKEVTISSAIGPLCNTRALGNYSARDLWDHSLGVAILARELAVHAKTVNPEEAFTAGMLHDVGLLITSQSESAKCAQLFSQAESPDAQFTSLEHSMFGFTHAELGERLGEKWKFPDYVSAAIRWHHEPEQAPLEFREMCLFVTVADKFCGEAKVGFPLTCRHQEITDQQLETIRLSREQVLETSAKLPILLRLFV
jgi:putative nucleotidyltransferase with HDIG domain